MTQLIPVYPPDEIKTADGISAIEDAPPVDIVVTAFRSTDHIITGQHGGLGPTVPLVIVGANPLRRVLTIRNEGAVDVYLGGNENVTTTTGFRIGVGQSMTIETGGDIYGITPSGVGVVHWLAEIEVS